MQVQHIRIPNSTFYSKILFFRQFIFIIYLSFLSYKYLKNEVQSGISHVQSIIPLFYNIYCILHPDFNGTNTHIPRNQKDRNCRLFSLFPKGQMRVPALLVPQASPRAVSELTISILFLSSEWHFWVFIIHCHPLRMRTGGNSFYHIENVFQTLLHIQIRFYFTNNLFCNSNLIYCI